MPAFLQLIILSAFPKNSLLFWPVIFPCEKGNSSTLLPNQRRLERMAQSNKTKTQIMIRPPRRPRTLLSPSTETVLITTDPTGDSRSQVGVETKKRRYTHFFFIGAEICPTDPSPVTCGRWRDPSESQAESYFDRRPPTSRLRQNRPGRVWPPEAGRLAPELC